MAEPITSDLAQLPAPPPARRPEPYGSESRAYSPEGGPGFQSLIPIAESVDSGIEILS